MRFTLLLACVQLFAIVPTVHAAAPISFADEIQPILERSCLPCHNATKAEGGLQLETPKLMLQGGDTGPSIVPNRALDSAMFLNAAHLKKPFMPPEANKPKAPKLTSMQVELLRRWIDEGAQGNPKPKQPVAWKPMPASVKRIGAVAVSPDGQFAACARGASVEIYAVPLKRSLASFPAHADLVGALAFSPDGMLFASGSYGEFKLWKMVPGAAPMMPEIVDVPELKDAAADISKRTNATSTIAVKSDAGAVIIAGGSDGKVRIWNGPTKELILTISVDGPVKFLAANVNRHYLAVATEGHPIRLIDFSSGKTIADLSGDRASLDGNATADLDVAGAAFELSFLQNELKNVQARIGTQSDELKKVEKEHTDFETKRAAIEKAKTDGTAKRDALMKSRDEAEDAGMNAMTNQTAAKTAESDAQKLAADAKAALEKAAPAEKATAQKKFDEATAVVKKAVDARAGADKAANDAAEKQKKIKTEFDEAAKVFADAVSEVQRADVAAANFKNLNEAVRAARDEEKALKAAIATAEKVNADALKAQTAAREQTAKFVLPPAKSLAFSRDGKALMTEHTDGTIRAWIAETGAPLETGNIAPRWELVRTVGDAAKIDSPLTARVNALAFSPDGKMLATGSGDPSRSGEIKLWDTATGQLMREIPKPHKDAVLALDFSSDGTTLASGAADKAVRLWDVATGKMSKNLEAHSSHVLAVSLRHDMRRLASAGADNCIKTWNLQTSDVLKTISDFPKEVNGLRYLGHGDQLLAVSGGPVVRIVKDGGGDVRAKTDGFAKYITASAASRDGQIQAIGDATGTFFVINFEGKILAQWSGSAVSK